MCFFWFFWWGVEGSKMEFHKDQLMTESWLTVTDNFVWYNRVFKQGQQSKPADSQVKLLDVSVG